MNNKSIEINIGIDFGTSFTKACYYILDKGERSIVHWKPIWQKESNPLLPSNVYLDNNDNISMFLLGTNKTKNIKYFKMAVAGQPIGDKIYPNKITKIPAYQLYSAFYLSRALSYIEYDIKIKYRQLLHGKDLVLSGNLGIPVAYYDSEYNIVFKEILSAARYMQNSITDIEPISKIDELYSASLQKTPDQSFNTVPELYAEATGLFSDKQTNNGIYTLFDIGGGTVDGAAIQYCRNDGRAHVNFITAQVEPLGVEVAATELVSAHFAHTLIEARNRLLEPNGIYFNELSSLKHKLECQTAYIIVPIKKKACLAFSAIKELPILLYGGGHTSGWYRESIISTYTDFKHKKCNIPQYKLHNTPLFGGNIKDIPSDQLHRYLIAIGLSIPAGYGPDIEGLPRQNPDIQTKNSNNINDLDDIQREKYGDY